MHYRSVRSPFQTMKMLLPKALELIGILLKPEMLKANINWVNILIMVGALNVMR